MHLLLNKGFSRETSIPVTAEEQEGELPWG